MAELIDKFGTEAPMFKGRVVMILIWNPAPIISNINNHLYGFVIIVCICTLCREASPTISECFQGLKVSTKTDMLYVAYTIGIT